ncbi:MAG: hypothetical protein OXE80_00765 [Gammaproteobacteria bacterium]|nr:hypothetical protein [Gammaproteobacteria bacterium]MCY4268689.1 hypothetical protein [Gammaproteobacteria bacterium]MCY4296228.1 hypothetical protein [Gammaproteobacteria bacterium]
MKKDQDTRTTQNPKQPSPGPATSLDSVEAALRRAAQSAYRRAAFYGSKVVIFENGKIVHKTPVPVNPKSKKPPAYQEYKLV